jgi:PBP1b-binding outer membrane lipoprotein LpoB
MQRALAVFVCLLTILMAGCATKFAPRAEKRTDENAARSVALTWLQLLDQGNYESVIFKTSFEDKSPTSIHESRFTIYGSESDVGH